jgi:ethanolamine utilization protein EutL
MAEHTILRPTLLSCRQIDDVDVVLGAALVGPSFDAARHRSLGLITVDQDDSAYVALDEATKHADVEVVFGRSFYAGAAHASGPLSGEVLGIVASKDPDEVAEALWVIKGHLAEQVYFQSIKGPRPSPFLAHVVSSCGSYLAGLAGVPVGAPLAYLIAAPIEAVVAVDAAVKAAPVTLQKFLPPPSETNFAGAFLSGDLADLHSARDAFVDAIARVAAAPLAAARRPDRLRR